MFKTGFLALTGDVSKDDNEHRKIRYLPELHNKIVINFPEKGLKSLIIDHTVLIAYPLDTIVVGNFMH